MIQIFSPCAWIPSSQQLDDWVHWTFPTPLHKLLLTHCTLGRDFMNPDTCFTIIYVWHNTFTSCVPEVREFVVWYIAQGRQTALGSPQSLIPPPTSFSYHMTSWITNWRRYSPTQRANKRSSSAQGYSCLSTWVQVLWSLRVPTLIWYFRLCTVGLDAHWVEGGTSAG